MQSSHGDPDTENRLVDTEWERSGMNEESIMEIHTLPYVKWIASGNLPYNSGNSNWGSVTSQKSRMEWEVGGSFKRERTYVYLWLIHVIVWQKPQYGKAIILQLKICFQKLIKENIQSISARTNT